MTELAMMPSLRSWFHRLVERLLPYYDPETERARDAKTEAITQRAIRVRIQSEKVRADYAAMGRRLTR